MCAEIRGTAAGGSDLEFRSEFGQLKILLGTFALNFSSERGESVSPFRQNLKFIILDPTLSPFAVAFCYTNGRGRGVYRV